VRGQPAWAVIGMHLEELLGFALTLKPGELAPVFCDPAGRTLAFRAPSGEAAVLLCTARPPRLEDCYGVRRKGDAFENAEGERLSSAELPRFLADYALGARDGGAEWGWEFDVGQ